MSSHIKMHLDFIPTLQFREPTAHLHIYADIMRGAFNQLSDSESRSYVIPLFLAMCRAFFARQAKWDSLFSVINSLIIGCVCWVGLHRRKQLIHESTAHFHPEMFLRNYAQALITAMHGEPFQYNGVLQSGRP